MNDTSRKTLCPLVNRAKAFLFKISVDLENGTNALKMIISYLLVCFPLMRNDNFRFILKFGSSRIFYDNKAHDKGKKEGGFKEKGRIG